MIDIVKIQFFWEYLQNAFNRWNLPLTVKEMEEEDKCLICLPTDYAVCCR